MKEIKLTQGKVALVDDDDFEYLNQWKWTGLKKGKTFYAVRNDKGKRIYMHRQILCVTASNILVDHEDHNGCNNQRYNIRKCNKSQNQCNIGAYSTNTSGYKGLYYDKRNSLNRWTAYIMVNGKRTFLGSFNSKEDAALEYNKKATELHGEFANLNILPCGI